MAGLTALMQVVMLVAALRVVLGADEHQMSSLFMWDLVALAYLGVGVLSARRQANHPDAAPASSAPRGSRRFRLAGFYWGVLPTLFSVLGLSAALDVLFVGQLPDSGSSDGALIRGLAAVAIITAWMMMHLSYARLYQYIVERDGAGLEFPGAPERPTAIEFLYFAVTVGASFATSDASITTTRMRWSVLVHSVLSFFYNAIVLAVGFRILTGG